MNPIAALLLKVLVTRFYVINAGFLLFVFFVFFGMVNSGQLIAYHRSLITGMIGSPVFMALVWLGWLLYEIKCILSNTTAVRAADSTYLLALNAIPSVAQYSHYLVVSVMQYLPVLLYTFFILYVAISQSKFLVALMVVAFQLLMIGMGTRMIFLAINQGVISPRFEKMVRMLNAWKPIRLGYLVFLTGYLLHNRKIALLVVKVFSILLLSVSFVRNGDQFDEDLFGIFLQLIFVAHALLVFYCVDFYESLMQFSRNLPVSLIKVAGGYFITYSILVLPEMVFILINNQGNLQLTEIWMLFPMTVAILFLYTSLLYVCNLDMESYLLLIFVVFLCLFFFQKAVPPWVSVLSILSLAGVLIRVNFCRFEK